MELSHVEVRALGSLLEKEASTPQAYPLTLNSLVAACNQTSNRAPVLQLETGEVERALDSLKAAGLVRFVHASHGSRVERYRHVMDERLGLDRPELAVLALLALRGPQTPGELRGRSERLWEFADIEAVQESLDRLAGRPEPLVVRLARRLGHKELRWAHLLSGQPVDVADAAPPAPPPRTERLDELEARMAAVEAQLAELRSLLE
jgi:hypothetical protein